MMTINKPYIGTLGQPVVWVLGGTICLNNQWQSNIKKKKSHPFGDTTGTEITHFTFEYIKVSIKNGI